MAGTVVKTETGDKPIEEIKSGDYVWSADTETGEIALKRVVRTFVNEKHELVHVKIVGETITSTPEHPFFVVGNESGETGLSTGWVYTKNLLPGDVVRLSNGKTAAVESAVSEHFAEPVLVYNFEVEDFHTYFVGPNGVLVHNDCGMYSSDALQAAHDYLGPGYRELSPDRYVSADGARQIRIGDKDIYGKHAGGPHINFDKLGHPQTTFHVYITEK